MSVRVRLNVIPNHVYANTITIHKKHKRNKQTKNTYPSSMYKWFDEELPHPPTIVTNLCRNVITTVEKKENKRYYQK